MTAMRVYTLKEAAEYLRIKEHTLMGYLQEGEVQGFKIGGKSWRITEEALDEFIRTQIEKEQESIRQAKEDGQKPKRRRKKAQDA
jgi:excisionase family DNA binding protein